MIEINVYGIPKGQARGRTFSPKGSNRPVTWSPKDTPWHQQVITAVERHRQEPLHEGPVNLYIRFSFLLPKSISEKKRPWMIVKPDLDNLVKVIKDAMSGVIYRDDAQVIFEEISKVYGDAPGAYVKVHL